MADIIDPPTPTRPLYPWDEWTDGAWREAVAGVDFRCTYRSFEQMVHGQATHRGMKAETRRTAPGKRLAFRFIRT